MSKTAEYRRLERDLADQLAALDALKDAEAHEREIQFETQLRSLLREYDMSLRDVTAMFEPYEWAQS